LFCGSKCKAAWHRENPMNKSVTSDMFLTRDELEQFTGYHKSSFMINKLREYGLRFFVAADGYPRVIRSDLEGPKHKKKTAPNIGFLTSAG